MCRRRWSFAVVLLPLLCTTAIAKVNDSSAGGSVQAGQTWEAATEAAEAAGTSEAAEAELLKWALCESNLLPVA